jgi:hypothetical protein
MKGKWILTVTIIAMLGYQAWRVYDYMSTSLTDVDENTAFWVALAFLAFTEIGLLVWLHVAQPGATTKAQESVSTAMVWVDYAGSMVLGLADLAKHNTMYVIDLSRIDPVLFFAPWLIVAANVAAWIVFESNDSDEKLRREERRLAHAEHEVEIKARQEAIAEVNANMAGLSRQLAPYYFKDVSERVTGRTAARFGRQAAKLPELPPIQVTDVPMPKPGLLAGIKAKLLGRPARDWRMDADEASALLDNAMTKLQEQIDDEGKQDPTLPGQ